MLSRPGWDARRRFDIVRLQGRHLGSRFCRAKRLLSLGWCPGCRLGRLGHLAQRSSWPPVSGVISGSPWGTISRDILEIPSRATILGNYVGTVISGFHLGRVASGDYLGLSRWDIISGEPSLASHLMRAIWSEPSGAAISCEPSGAANSAGAQTSQTSQPKFKPYFEVALYDFSSVSLFAGVSYAVYYLLHQPACIYACCVCKRLQLAQSGTRVMANLYKHKIVILCLFHVLYFILLFAVAIHLATAV